MPNAKNIGLFLFQESCEAGFDAGRFVFVNDISFCSFIQCRKYRGERFCVWCFSRPLYEGAQFLPDRRIVCRYFFVPPALFFCLFCYWHREEYTIKNSKLKIQNSKIGCDRYIMRKYERFLGGFSKKTAVYRFRCIYTHEYGFGIPGSGARAGPDAFCQVFSR